MSEYIKLEKEDLEFSCEFLPGFDDTSEISSYKDIIGQERAVEAVDLGLLINKKGYNIFACGKNGTGKRSYIIKRIMEYAKKLPTPDDWCYVYNFRDYNKPLALRLSSGTAESFKDEVEGFINLLFQEVPRYFSMENYERDRNSIIEKYQREIIKLADKLYEEAKERSFNVKSTSDGFAFIPIREGKEMSEKEYNDICEEEREQINSNVSYLKLIAYEVLKQTKAVKKDMAEELKKLDDSISRDMIQDKINDLIRNFGMNDKILQYLYDLQDDIVENIDAFLDDDENKYDESFFKRYCVNVMVCNRDVCGAPVVYEDAPEFHNLIGIVEYENRQGSMVTDFTMIQPGSLHKANGGYIIMDALSLLGSYQGWEALKRTLKTNGITIENLKNQFDIIPLVTLKPEEISVSVKVILIGGPSVYQLLYLYDEDFRELFKIKADFEDEIRNINGVTLKLLGFMANYCEENKIFPISRDGIIEILKYSFRMAESKKYFTASMDKILDLIDQSYIIAQGQNREKIGKNHVKTAINMNLRRHGAYKDKILGMYKEGKYIVDLDGYKVGQINGLSVLDFGDIIIGKQNKISVATYAGKEGIINIERETNMSGDIHSKGIMILSGYIGETFGQSIPLSFNASICFEQLYGEVDGDSASAAELIALMSSLGDMPINQSISITGSVNQRGEIQPIGGINEKIEGYFDICSIFGLNGKHGVIMPYSNMDELILKDEVISAVDKGLFHIYAVKTIEDCIDILSDDNFRSHPRRKAVDVLRDNITSKLEKYRNTFNEKPKK